VQVAPRGAATSIILATWFERPQPGAMSNIVLETDDIDGDVAALAACASTAQYKSDRGDGSLPSAIWTVTA
jgi:hypothetical protein